MATPRDAARARFRGPTLLALTSLGLSALLGACSSSAASSGSAAAGTASTTAVHATCAQVSAVLSDGPDPDSDPVGYAEAQILPLGQIRTSDAQLRAAISKLAGAYRTFFDSNGTSASAKLSVAAASKRINSFCPGAAS
jgi:hypothetical protein